MKHTHSLFHFLAAAKCLSTLKSENSVLRFEDLVSEYDDCNNNVYACELDTASYGRLTVPVTLITTPPHLSYGDRNAASIRLSCLTIFLLTPFPDNFSQACQNLNSNVEGLITSSARNRGNALIVTHVLTSEPGSLARWPIRAHYNLHFSYFIEHTILRGSSSIIKSQIRLGRYTTDFEYVEITPNSTGGWRGSFASLSGEPERINQGYFFTDYNHFPPLRNVSLAEVVSHHFGNPFTFKDSIESFDRVLTLLCAEQLNVTVARRAENADPTSPKALVYFINAGVRHMVSHKIRSPEPQELHVIPTDENYMNFVTCDGVGRPISLTFYLSPYDLPSWLVEASFVFLITPIPITIFEISKFKSWRQGWGFYGSIIYFFLSASFEVSPLLPTMIHLRGQSLFVLTSWAVLNVVLVNAYKGIFVSDLTSPPPLERKWKSVKEMKGFVFMNPISFNTLMYENMDTMNRNGYDRVKAFYGLRSAMCFPDAPQFIYRICRLEYPRYARYFPLDIPATMKKLGFAVPEYEEYCGGSGAEEFRNELGLYKKNSSAYRKTQWSDDVELYVYTLCTEEFYIFRKGKKERTAGTSLAPFHNALLIFTPSPITRIKSLPKLLSTCNRNGYIDLKRKLDYFLETADKAGFTNFKLGDDKLFSRWEGYVIMSGSFASKGMFRAMQRLLASGVYQVWEKWFPINNPQTEELGKKYRSTREAAWSGLSITSNIYTSFVILATCISVSIFCFLVEIGICYFLPFISIFWTGLTRKISKASVYLFRVINKSKNSKVVKFKN